MGLTGFLVGSVLIILGSGEEKKAVSAIPWNVILMVMGVGILMNIISLSGGIDIMVGALEKVMSQRTASMIMAVAAGIMSFFSSGLGVVFPTLIPTASGLSASLGVDAVQMVAVIVIGGTVSGFTPISTTGALIMAGVAQQENAEERFPSKKISTESSVRRIICRILYCPCRPCPVCLYRCIWLDWGITFLKKCYELWL